MLFLGSQLFAFLLGFPDNIFFPFYSFLPSTLEGAVKAPPLHLPPFPLKNGTALKAALFSERS